MFTFQYKLTIIFETPRPLSKEELESITNKKEMEKQGQYVFVKEAKVEGPYTQP